MFGENLFRKSRKMENLKMRFGRKSFKLSFDYNIGDGHPPLFYPPPFENDFSRFSKNFPLEKKNFLPWFVGLIEIFPTSTSRAFYDKNEESYARKSSNFDFPPTGGKWENRKIWVCRSLCFLYIFHVPNFH